MPPSMQVPHLEPWQWALAGLAAFCIGLSKTGIAGLGIAAVAIFSSLFPPRESVGIVLLVLICADFVAVAFYRQHAEWQYLLRLFPWTAAGVTLGWLAMDHVNEAQAKKLIGGILVLMVVFQMAQRIRKGREAKAAEANGATGTAEDEPIPHSLWFVAATGIGAGFTTMVANAAGPIMILYLLAMRLPKMAFIGTAAWYFLLINLFKVPFGINLGIIHLPALKFAATLFPLAILGGLSGRAIIKYINQKVFEVLALTLTLLAGLRMLF